MTNGEEIDLLERAYNNIREDLDMILGGWWPPERARPTGSVAEMVLALVAAKERIEKVEARHTR